jgi:hypothetical protein
MEDGWRRRSGRKEGWGGGAGNESDCKMAAVKMVPAVEMAIQDPGAPAPTTVVAVLEAAAGVAAASTGASFAALLAVALSPPVPAPLVPAPSLFCGAGGSKSSPQAARGG